MPDILGPASNNAVTVRPDRSIVRGAVDTWFRDCSSPLAQDGTEIGADFMNDILAQVRVALLNSGINRNGADDMLWRAMQSTGIRYAADSGTANNIECAFAPPVTTLYDGLMVHVKIAASVTGATTITCNDLAPVPVQHRDNSALAADDLIAGQLALFGYRGGVFQLLSVIGEAGGGGGSAGAGVTGQLVLATGNVALPGTLKANGALVSRASYPELWTYAAASNRIVSDADWLNSAQKRWTAYSSGDGETTFRLPDLRGEFLRFFDDARGVDAGRVLGQAQAEMIGPHTHPTSVTLGSPSGLVRWDEPQSEFYIAENGDEVDQLLIPKRFQANSVNMTVNVNANTGTENRVRNAAFLACIVY